MPETNLRIIFNTMKQTFLLFAALVTLAFQACTKTFYVSPDGNDANPGSKGSPFLTLGQAVQAAAEKLLKIDN